MVQHQKLAKDCRLGFLFVLMVGLLARTISGIVGTGSSIMLAVGGAIIGYLTGIVVSTGPLSSPLFLFYGLTKGAFLATEVAGSIGLI